MKRKIDTKKILIISSILVILIGVVLIIVLKPKKTVKPKTNNKKQHEKKKEEPKEKVDIIDVTSKTRPLAVSINNTPVAIKVQQGLNDAYLIYEIATEGSTSRLLAFYKDVPDTKVGTIRSARHNMFDFALESDAIFVGYGWSIYAENQLKRGDINFVQGIIGEGGMKRENPEHLASEHTVYLQTDKIYNTAAKKGYKKESSSANNTVVLNYNVGDVDLSQKEGAKAANTVTVQYGSVTNKFIYDAEKKMYTRNVNGKDTVDHKTKEKFTTKNIIVERLTYSVMGNHYYWNLKTIGSGDGYYITNGYAVPIKWSKSDRKAKTKYTYLDGKEIEVSDGRTYIEVQVTGRKTTIN